MLGRPLFDPGDEVLGTIAGLLFTPDGQITAVVIAFGGFLSIGDRHVAIPFDVLDLTIDENGGAKWTANITQDQLAAAPDFTTLAQREEAAPPAPEPAPAPAPPAIEPEPAPATRGACARSCAGPGTSPSTRPGAGGTRGSAG